VCMCVLLVVCVSGKDVGRGSDRCVSAKLCVYVCVVGCVCVSGGDVCGGLCVRNASQFSI